VRSDAEARGTPVLVRDNRFDRDHTGVVAGNVAVQIEHNEFLRSQDAAVHLVGAGANVRNNHVSGGAAMGIIAENANGAVIENNELDGLPAYGIMVRGSGNTLVRGNRIYNCGYGLAFVLGNAGSPSTAVSNTVIEPRFNGIDVIGDSPILRRNQIVRPHALALNVQDYRPPDGRTVRGEPFLEDNSFGGAPSRLAESHR